MQELIAEWNKTRSKTKHFEILNRVDCPRELVMKALTIYEPQDVLSVDAIWLAKEWGNDQFLIVVYEIVYSGRCYHDIMLPDKSEQALALYVLAITTEDPSEVFYVTWRLDDKKYLKKILRKHRELFTELEFYPCIWANINLHRQEVKVMTPDELLRLLRIAHNGGYRVRDTATRLLNETHKYKKISKHQKEAYIQALAEYLEY
jgi:hypothetical protein